MQGYFELLHIPYSTSGVLVEAMTFDKYVLNNYLHGWDGSRCRSQNRWSCMTKSSGII